MYADFEAILEPIKSPGRYPESSYTKVINQHIPSGFCVNSKFAYDKVENLLKNFIELRSVQKCFETLSCVSRKANETYNS